MPSIILKHQNSTFEENLTTSKPDFADLCQKSIRAEGQALNIRLAPHELRKSLFKARNSTPKISELNSVKTIENNLTRETQSEKPLETRLQRRARRRAI